MFLIVTEELNILLAKANRYGFIKGIKFAYAILITHLLFIDDVILFGRGNM
jgi:hypothetical protein